MTPHHIKQLHMKRCSKCKSIKPLAEFHQCKSKKDGLRTQCKSCRSILNRNYYDINKDKISSSVRDWAKRNPGKVVAKKRNRRIRERNAFPSWANHNAIDDIYRDMKEFRDYGLDVVVDHIIPLKGKLVCGLHVENNLTLKLRSYNARKSNKFDPDKFDN